MVLRRLYTLPEKLRSADFRVAYVPCKERWASTVRMEAPVGSLKCWLVVLRFCESCTRWRPGCKSMEGLPTALHHQFCVGRLSG